MSWSPADARFLLARSLGLARRGAASLRSRGLRATWDRVGALLHFGSPVLAQPLLSAPPFVAANLALPASPEPRASIIIPVHGQFGRTLDCLRALAAWPPLAAIEIIVVDDASGDATASELPKIEGLRYHRRDTNGGFIAACNDGANIARGEFLVFLNNDTVPQPGWLDSLLALFDAHPDAGMACAQLLYPDGRLQDAGGFLTRDGEAQSYGRFDTPEHCRYAYVRDVDYASGAALAVRRGLFAGLGGFDSRYAPAYYEDTDLAFAMRSAGHRVMYQPLARVVHDEGGTAGTDTGVGVKASQPRNRQVFAERWKAELASLPAPGTLPSPAVVHRRQRQVLVIDSLTPRPDHDSGSLRLVNLMRLLRDEGAHVVFFPADRKHDGRYTGALQQLGVETWYAPFARRAPAWLREHGPRFHSVLACRHYVAREFLPLLRRHAPQARVVFDTIDLHYLRERRAAELAGDRTGLAMAARTRALELDAIARSDATLVVSAAERELLALDAPGATVEILTNLHEVAGPGLPYDARHDLVFVGGFRHPPNVDAVRWFVGEVFPRVRERLPGVRFHCIGSNVVESVRALASEPGVVVHGHVPDITPYMDGCRVSVAPLRYGAGVKGKVNLSMAHGQPVVATHAAVEGMHLRDGEDVLVAGDAAAFAEAVVRLYTDRALWERLSLGGMDNIARHFSLDAARDAVRRVLL